MKNIFLSLLFAASLHTLSAQTTTPCTGHPLFSSLANHSLKNCDTKEFEKLEISITDKAKKTVTEEKTGEYLKVAYSFDGDFNTRPSSTQIYQNYAAAITKERGEILYNGARGFFGKFKKAGDVYWIKVYSDGSGWYWIETVKEIPMRQDVVLTASEIKKNLAADGKVAFYGIYFDVNKAVLKTESTPALTALAEFLKANPYITIFIVGHTDNTGDFNRNLILSKERAAAVLMELADKHKVNKNQLSAEGVASLAPVASNDTEEGKARNRRVEIVKK